MQVASVQASFQPADLLMTQDETFGSTKINIKFHNKLFQR